MFIQVLHGKVRDADLLDRQLEVWRNEVRPKVKGFLGSTGGVTADGTLITIARFESADHAHANSDSSTQNSWFEATAKAFDGKLTFHDYTDVDTFLDGGSDEAGFVQVMQGHTKDAQAMRNVEKSFEAEMRQVRPDLIGSVTGFLPDGSFTQVGYFTSEKEARVNEKLMAGNHIFDEYMALIDGDMTFYDLTAPIYM